MHSQIRSANELGLQNKANDNNVIECMKIKLTR